MRTGAAEIRQAIAGGQYQDALERWNAYAGQLREALHARTLSATQMEEARSLFAWARAVLLSARADLQARSRHLAVAEAYLWRRPRSLRLDTRL